MSDVTNAQLLTALEASTQASLKQAQEYSKLAAGLAVHGQRLESGQRSIDGLTTAIQGKDGKGGLVSHVAVMQVQFDNHVDSHRSERTTAIAAATILSSIFAALITYFKGGN